MINMLEDDDGSLSTAGCRFRVPPRCTPWGNPTRNVLGWQRPCYLLSDEGYAPSFKSLMEDTEWEKYGVGRNPKCRHCMVHSGFEATAVEDALRHPLETLMLLLRSIRK